MVSEKVDLFSPEQNDVYWELSSAPETAYLCPDRKPLTSELWQQEFLSKAKIVYVPLTADRKWLHRLPLKSSDLKEVLETIYRFYSSVIKEKQLKKIPAEARIHLQRGKKWRSIDLLGHDVLYNGFSEDRLELLHDVRPGEKIFRSHSMDDICSYYMRGYRSINLNRVHRFRKYGEQISPMYVARPFEEVLSCLPV